MTTELKRFTEAYATLTFATYEPLIVRWFSGLAVKAIATGYVGRAVRRATPARGGRHRRRAGDDASAAGPAGPSPAPGSAPHGPSAGPDLGNDLKPGLGLDDMPMGLGHTREAPPIIFGFSSRGSLGGIDAASLTRRIEDRYGAKLKELMTRYGAEEIPSAELGRQLFDTAKAQIGASGAVLANTLLWPVHGHWEEYLSPIGIAHFYRQLYFHVSEGVGPIEQAFSIGPGETLEIVTESVRRQSHEEIVEHGSEAISETAVESRNTDEISDKVASMVERDTSLAISSSMNGTGGANVGVYTVGGGGSVEASTDMSVAAKNSSELARRRLKEITNRAAERITKTFSLRVRDTVDYTTTNLQRRVIKNEGARPLSYGLRRVFDRMRVKVQNLGPRLVWQLYLPTPGVGLARSRFVHLPDQAPIAEPGRPPAILPQPLGGIDRGTIACALHVDTDRDVRDPMRWFVTLVIPVPPDREVRVAIVESVTDLAGGLSTPSANGASRPGPVTDETYSADFGISLQLLSVYNYNFPVDVPAGVLVTYQYVYNPSKEVLKDWEDEYNAAMAEFQAAEAVKRDKALREEFERQKQLITERSRIRARPSADLRREERYEILNRLVSHLFRPGRGGVAGAPAPIEIEYFHRYFDLEGLFFHVHPSWWMPRYDSFGRADYEITADSEPARLGRSLGWMIQLDGDDRRNEFINSPWLRVCLPIRASREREALAWLAEHIEGDLGYDPAKDPLKTLLGQVEAIRTREQAVAAAGPDYVSAETPVVVSATPGAPAGPLQLSDVYPVIDEFEVTVPTEGFVYDDLVVTIP
jgi:hypothetical protein